MNYCNGKKIYNTVSKSKNTAEYVVARLVDLGISHAFTIPGDFAFPIDHALVYNEKLKNIINANELNASYAADGYARVRGAAILCTTYAVGELSALNGVMGSKAENLVVFHLVGTPNDAAIAKRRQVHHTLGDGIFGNFADLSASAACVSAIITPDNARSEMNRIIKEAFKHRKPAYIQISFDDGNRPVTDTTFDDDLCHEIISNPEQLSQAIKLIIGTLTTSKKIIAIPSLKLDRFGITNKALKLVEKLNIPFVVMPHDKSIFSEHHPQYVGFYAGLLSDDGVSDLVENADLILNIGDVFWSDFNTSGFTNNLNLNKVLNLAPHYVENQKERITNVYLSELLDILLEQVVSVNYMPIYKHPQLKQLAITKNKLTLKSFYNQLLHFLKPNDNLVVETGSSSLNLPKFKIPEGTRYFNQTLWGSIGWATPATLGVSLADTDSRSILVTGEGSHQLTLNELGVMGRYKVNPIIFCINNDGYMVERALELNPDYSYDDVAKINYTKLPEAFACENWLVFKVQTEQELFDALNEARNYSDGVYIEVVTGKYDYGDTLNFFNNHLKEMYG